MNIGRSRLIELLVALPGDALLPASWLLAQMNTEGTAPPPTVADLTVEAFAQVVDRSEAQVRAWCAAGNVPGAYRLPGKKRPGAWRIPRWGVRAFRDQNEATSPAARASQPQETNIGAWRAVRTRRPRSTAREATIARESRSFNSED